MSSSGCRWERVPRARLTLTLAGAGASLDTVFVTTEDFKPAGADPRDNTPPAPSRTQGEAVGGTGQVKLTWDKCEDADLHHYSVYCGADKTFKCDNSTLIRSVFRARSRMPAWPLVNLSTR